MRQRLVSLRLASLVAVLLLTPVLVSAQGDKDDDKEKAARLAKASGWKLTNIFAGVTDARGLDEAAATKTIKERLASASDGKNLQAVGELFQKHPFAVVEKIAKNKGLSPVEAGDLGRLRRRMIHEAMAKAIEAVDPKKTLTIGMLDSGNKASGIASDVDQTVFVMPKDKAKALGVDEAKVIAEFEKQFVELYKVHPERLGIESMNGADFYPDWRQAHSTDKVGTGAHDLGKEASALMAEGDRVVAEKRKNSGAYRSEGQLKSQAEGRGHEALQQHHERVSSLREARDEIEEIGRNPDLSDADRKAKAAAVEAALVKKYAKDYPAATLAELEEKFAQDSPWTEIGWGEDGKTTTSHLEDPAGKVLANKPELHERFAFDGSWDNWLMYEHHPHNRRKYLLRSVAEGVSLRRGAAGTALSVFEYETVFAKNTLESKAELKAFVDDVYKGLPDATREQYGKALDVAAKERLRHKGVKNPSTGADYTLKEVWSEFWPALSEKERALYKDLPPASLEKLLLERATRTWEAVGREVMIENLERTIDAPAKLLGGLLSDAELARVKTEFPDATRAKLAAAVQRQIYHGIHDLISIEHARELVAPDALKKTLPPRQKDLVDRLLEKLGGKDSELGKQVLKIARAAACKRVVTEPGERKFRQEVYSYLRESVREFVTEKSDEFKEARDRAKALYEDFKSGKLPREVVAQKLTLAAAERLASAKVEALRALGFDVKDAHLLIPEAGWPKLEIEFGAQKWDGKKLLGHLANAGNVDSALSVILAYQEGGAEAAAWAAGFELVMNIPGVSEANALKDLVVHKRPEGVVMLGATMLVPVAGQVFLFINIAKTSVTILGHVVLDPLKDDDADKMYQGFLDKTSGFKDVEKSRRPSLLHFVPIRVIPKTVEGPDKKKITTLVWRYSRLDAERIFNVVDEKEYNKLFEAGVLGGGADWTEAFATVRSEGENARGNFEARRASMYYHFGEGVKAKLAPKKLDIDETEALPLIVEFFKDYVEQWVHAKGAFAEFDENVTISRRFEDKALREKIATRAASDFLYSFKLCRGSVIAVSTIERSTEARIQQQRNQEIADDANGLVVSLDEAWKQGVDGRFASALDRELERRKQEARVRSPRFHVRPRVVAEADGESVEFLISVVDGPAEKELTPKDKEYKTNVRYELAAAARDEIDVTAYVTVTGAQTGEKIPPYAPPRSDTFSVTKEKELAVKLGKLTRSGSLPESVNLKVAYQVKGDTKGTVVYDDVSADKATTRTDSWAGKDVSGFAGQVWICWEKAPATSKAYRYELEVTGGARAYKKREEGPISPRDRFPDKADKSGRENVFVLPFAWPEGEVGSFTLKGTIHSDAEKFDFTRTFEIPDARLADSSKLVLRYARESTLAEIPSLPGLTQEDKDKFTKYAQGNGGKWRIELYEPFDSSRTDLWQLKWVGHPPETHSQFQMQIHVRWKDAPPDALYFYELTVSGGAPARDVPVDGGVNPTFEFPPAPYKAGKGSSAFVVPVDWPGGRGGSFVVKGTLHAVAKEPYPADWRKAKSLGTFPFEQRFKLENKSRFMKGTVRVSDDSMVAIQVLLAYVQRGSRLVKVEAGGKTAYDLLDADYYSGGYFPDKPHYSHWVNIHMPYGAAPTEEATVTFMDYGETVTEKVKLVPELPAGDVARSRKYMVENEKKWLAEIDVYKKKNEEVYLDPIARLYDDLANSARHLDKGKWKEYALKSRECWDRLREKARAAAKNESDMKYVRESVASNATTLYGGLVEWGDVGEAESEFSAALGKISGAGLPAEDTNGRLASLYEWHGRNVVQLTGDLKRGTELFKKAQELAKTYPGLRPGAEVKCPYEVDPSFKGP